MWHEQSLQIHYKIIGVPGWTPSSKDDDSKPCEI